MVSPIIHVQCDHCGSWNITDNHADPDSAVRCVSEAENPPGSVAGSCCTAGHTHEDHAEHVRQTHDATCRTVTITIMPGPGAVQMLGSQMAGHGPQPAFGGTN
jgi:hypothetical protein